MLEGAFLLLEELARVGRSWSTHPSLERTAAMSLRQLVAATGATVCVVPPSGGRMTVVSGVPAAASDVFPHLPGQFLPPDSAADVVFAASGRETDPPDGHSAAQWDRRPRAAREHGADARRARARPVRRGRRGRRRGGRRHRTAVRRPRSRPARRAHAGHADAARPA
ncbi:hypothetical protein RB200_29535 [Streptomyces sp. PmtG]